MSVTDLQILVDQAVIHSLDSREDQLAELDATIERWADGSRRQVEAQNRLIEQNRLLQRRLAEVQAGLKS